MKLEQAMRIINGEPDGYIVDFEEKDGCILRGDYFPDVRNGEKPIATKEEAVDLAKRFAAADQKYKYVHVCSVKIRSDGMFDSKRVSDNFDDRKCEHWDEENQCVKDVII